MILFLCGFMGSGKTTVGKHLAKKLETDFFDLDDYIVQKEGRSIPQIFEKDGEGYFRQLEADSISEISKQGGVIATGGGTVTNPKTAEFVRNIGTVIYLDVPFETCYRRIKGDTNRPVVMKNTKEQLHEIYNNRKIIYKENSTYAIKANCKIEQITNKIIELIK